MDRTKEEKEVVGYDTSDDMWSPSAVCADCPSDSHSEILRGDEWGGSQPYCEVCGRAIDVTVVTT